MRPTMAALLVVVSITTAWAFTRDEVLLYVPFDGSAQPLVAAGGGVAHIKGEFSYGPGMVGQAILVGAKDTYLHYPTAGNMDPQEGTWAVWVHSVDWDLTSEKVNRWWIDCAGATRFILYHYLHSGGVFFYHMDQRRQRPSIISAPLDWRPGQWHHLAATWRDGRLRLYIDGQKVPQELQVELGPLGEFLNVGAPGKGVADTHLDELYVFSRALEAVEIQALFRRRDHNTEAALVLPRMSAPTLDGVMSPGEWSSAAAVTGFVNRVTGLADAEQGVAWLGWDDEYLYLAHRWPVPEKVRREPDLYSFGPVRKTATSPDDPALLEDDCVGIAASLEGSTRRILANALGTVWDDLGGVPSWSSGTRARSSLDAHWWSCEMAVPRSALSAAAEDKLRLQLVRTHRLLRSDDVSWPGAGREDFAVVALAADAPAVQLTGLGQPWQGLVDLRLSSTAPARAAISTDSGEVQLEHQLSPTSPLELRRVLADTSATALRLQVSSGDQLLLAMALPFTYPPVLEVDRYWYPSWERMDVEISTRGAASLAPALVEVLPPGGGAPLRSQRADGGIGDLRTISVDMHGLAPGQYPVRVTLGEAGAPLSRQDLTLEVRERPEWLGNQLGVLDHVPAPWTPLSYHDSKVQCWGRELDFSGSPFPAHLTSQGQQLLAAPIRLVATVNGQELALSDTTIQWIERGDLRGRWTGTGRLGAIAVAVTGWVEFDGLMWFDVDASAEGTTVEALRLEIPMNQAQSTLLYSGDYRTIGTGSTPAQRWSRSFTPCVGLSNERVGLQWYAQSQRGWRLSSAERALEVVPSPSTNTLTVNLIDTATTLGRRSFSFGLHATPVRPPLEGRRLIRPLGKASPKANVALWFTHFSLGCSYNWPVREDRADAIRSRHEAGQRVMAYTRLAECSVAGPWYEYFRDEWRVHPGPRKAYDPTVEWDATGNPVCPQSASWRDFTVWSIMRACEALDFDGLYYDVSRPPLCANAAHGCGYCDEEGNWQPEVQLLAMRELQKRLWVLMHEHFGGKLVTHHMSGDVYLITQSFSDLLIDGENFTSMLEDNYYQLLPLDKFRAEFMCHQWGPTGVFLPEFSRAQLTPARRDLYNSPDKLPVVRHLAGMIFLHDSLPWPSYSDLTPYFTIWDAQDALGWGDDVEFLPYWDNGAYLDPMGEALVASIYRRQGRALVVLFNNTDEAQQARMVFHLDRLGVSANKLRDFETDEQFVLDAGAVTVPIGARNFRLLLME